MRTKIGIVGCSGFVGSYIYNTFLCSGSLSCEEFEPNTDYDFVIDANGNSRKFWANQNPLEDFSKSVTSVYERMVINKPFKRFGTYVYISSIDAYQNNLYGMNKRIAEEIIKLHCDNWVILRCSAIIGEGMKKGVLYDLINERKTFLKPSSRLQFITLRELQNIVESAINNGISNQTFNVAGKDSVSVQEIADLFNLQVDKYGSEEQHFEYSVALTQRTFFPLKSSIEYVKEYLDARME